MNSFRKNFEILVITHADLDGAGCAIVLKTAYEGNKKVFVQQASDYPTADKLVREGLSEEHWDLIYITDLSVSKETAEYIEEHDKHRVILIDHHPDKNSLNEYDWCYINESNDEDPYTPSGTSLVFDYVKHMYTDIPKSMDKLVELVRQYDTWAWKNHFNNEEPKTFNSYLTIVGFKDFVKTMCERVYDEDLLNETDRTVLYYKEKEIETYIKSRSKTVEVREIDGMNIGFVFAEKHLSELGNYIVENDESIDCIIMFNMARGTVSIRSIVRENGSFINCTKLAKSWFNGGGHKLSGGGMILESRLDLVKNLLFDKTISYDMDFREYKGLAND